MKPFIIHDSNVEVNISIEYNTVENNQAVCVISDNDCFIFSEYMIKKNTMNSKLKVIDVDGLGILNPSFVMNTYKNHK